MDKQREKMIELIRKAKKETKGANCDLEREMIFADVLLANGVIVPPCKVGDKVYKAFNDEVKELKVISYSIMNSTAGNFRSIHTVNSRGAVLSYELRDFGKTVFLSREDAEKALKGVE